MSAPRTEKQKMLAGEYYQASDPEIQADCMRAKQWMAKYNSMLAAPREERHKLMSEQFAAVGEGAIIRPRQCRHAICTARAARKL